MIGWRMTSFDRTSPCVTGQVGQIFVAQGKPLLPGRAGRGWCGGRGSGGSAGHTPRGWGQLSTVDKRERRREIKGLVVGVRGLLGIGGGRKSNPWARFGLTGSTEALFSGGIGQGIAEGVGMGFGIGWGEVVRRVGELFKGAVGGGGGGLAPTLRLLKSLQLRVMYSGLRYATVTLLWVIGACTQYEENQALPLKDNPAFVKLPPGPECPPGTFLAGFQPHPECTTEEGFREYFGEEYYGEEDGDGQ